MVKHILVENSVVGPLLVGRLLHCVDNQEMGGLTRVFEGSGSPLML